jgi:RimJ/RimL family protein N-acetyltransferase
MEFEGIGFPVSMEQEQRWFEGLVNNPNRKVFIIEALSGKPALSVGILYLDIDWRHRSGNVSLTIDPNHQRKGYGSDAIRTAVAASFDVLGLERISATIFAFNVASLRAFSKAGFTEEGRKRKSYLWRGELQDQVLMSVLRAEHLYRK